MAARAKNRKEPCLAFTGQTGGGISYKLHRSDGLTLVVHMIGMLPFAAQNGCQSLMLRSQIKKVPPNLTISMASADLTISRMPGDFKSDTLLNQFYTEHSKDRTVTA